LSVLTPNLKSVFAAAYFTLTRFGRSTSVVHADVDVGVMQKIAESASEAAVTSFRNGFKAFVQPPSEKPNENANPQYKYVFDKEATKLEWKAFIVLLSFMLAGLHNTSGEEATDMIPLMRACFDSEYFGQTSKPIGALLFGFARNKVSSSTSVVH
jgi:hypothetical protein